MEVLDFRSDTVTLPTEEMRRAMAAAPVGDDVYGDDPTMNELQAYAADILGTEDAIYACSGTMGNLIAIMTHCGRGEGIMMGVNSHTWINEAGNAASIAGVMPFPLDDSTGAPTLESIRSAYKPPTDAHYAPTTLMVMENTHNSAGGVPIDVAAFAERAEYARGLGMKVHVDGARIFDAAAYFDVDVKEYASRVDSVQFCLSKGLGAPMGSLLCGKKDFIDRARRFRKALGGGQRQVGIAAAAGLVALRDMRGRLKEDHANAALLAGLLKDAGVEVEEVPARTNMVYFRTPGGLKSSELDERCLKSGLLLSLSSETRIRMVTHIGLDSDSVKQAVRIIKEAAGL
jgi:threonine aldolase